MPNMFGGDQLHPAYCPRKLEPNEVLVGNDLYTIKFEKDTFIRVDRENIDGRTLSWSGFLEKDGSVPSYISTAYVPDTVRKRIKRLFAKRTGSKPAQKQKRVVKMRAKRSR